MQKSLPKLMELLSAESLKSAGISSGEDRLFECYSDNDEHFCSAEKKQLKFVLTTSDYVFHWAKKHPQWLNDAMDALRDPSHEMAQLFAQLQSTSFRQDKPSLLELSKRLDGDLHLNRHGSEFELKRWLRIQRHYWSVQIAIADLLGSVTTRQATVFQSLLADVMIGAAYEWSYTHLSEKFGTPRHHDTEEAMPMCILAMGKLGGVELNFSSDIDLIFAFPEQGDTDREVNGVSKPVENQTFFTRLGQKIVTLLSENNSDGFVYRVDMRLRPYGESGALVSSFSALEDYYLEQGREWERFAMIKARIIEPLDGDIQTINHHHQRLESIIRPFSFRRYIDFSVLDAIRQLKQKITTEMNRSKADSDIKLGDGGIRECEFIVQSLQLIGGGRHPNLQVSNWHQSLANLEAIEMIKAEEGQRLVAAYDFLRKLENRLQIRAEKQTQQLPSDAGEQLIIATTMGYTSWSALEKALEQHRHHIAQFFRALFHDTEDTEDTSDEFKQWSRWLENSLSPSAEEELLSQYGLNQDALRAVRQFHQHFSERRAATRGLSRLEQLLPHLIVEVSKQPNAEQCLSRCIEILRGIGRRTSYVELLVENLPVLQFLVQLVSRSSWLAQQLAQYPSLMDELLFPANFGKQLSAEQWANQLRQATIRIEPDEIEEQLMALSRFKQASQFKIAAGDLTGRFDISQVSQQLTRVSEQLVGYLLQMAWREMVVKHGLPPHITATQTELSHEPAVGFVVLGYGKLGGDELGYGSDLDLVFLYQGDANALTQGHKPLETHQFYTKVAQRLVHYLGTRTQQGIMYEVDTRLRPSGRSGLLVSHIDAFREYQLNEAWTWEHQALTRARPIAGDDTLQAQYLQVRNEVLLARDNAELKTDVVTMRKKMRDTLDTSSDSQWDVKQGVGGLVDIEFLVQYAALKHARQLIGNEEDLPFNNADWLALLAEKDHIFKAEHHKLVDHYRELRTIYNFSVLQGLPRTLELSEIHNHTQANKNQEGSTLTQGISWVESLWHETFGPTRRSK